MVVAVVVVLLVAAVLLAVPAVVAASPPAASAPAGPKKHLFQLLGEWLKLFLIMFEERMRVRPVARTQYVLHTQPGGECK